MSAGDSSSNTAPPQKYEGALRARTAGRTSVEKRRGEGWAQSIHYCGACLFPSSQPRSQNWPGASPETGVGCSPAPAQPPHGVKRHGSRNTAAGSGLWGALVSFPDDVTRHGAFCARHSCAVLAQIAAVHPSRHLLHCGPQVPALHALAADLAPGGDSGGEGPAVAGAHVVSSLGPLLVLGRIMIFL